MEPNEHYVIQIEDLEVRIPYEKINETTIKISNPRPLRMDDLITEDFMIVVPFERFIDDIQSQIPPKLDGKFIEVAFESLFEIVFQHLKTHLQFEPYDLDLYIAENLLLYNGIREASKNGTFSEQQREAIYTNFREKIITLLPLKLKHPFQRS